MINLECSCCKNEKPAESVFVYDDENYCFECSSDLIYEMVSSGHLFMEHADMENKGVRLNW